MKVYTAKVVDSSGKQKTISEEAISQQLFEESLTSRGFYIVNIKQSDKKKLDLFSDTLKKTFLIDFTYNIFSLLEFGIDISEVFNILQEIYTKGREAQFIDEVSASMKKGENLSAALKHAKGSEIFDDFYITMVTSGEHSGNLTDAFRLIYAYIKNNQKIQQKLFASSVYPISIFSIAFLAIHALFLFIIPNFKQIYEIMDYTPKNFIKGMFDLSGFLVNNIIAYFAVLGSLIIGLIIFFRTKASKKFLSILLQKLPIVSKVYQLQSKIRVSFSLEILLKGGITLEDALHEMVEIESNPIAQKEYKKALVILKEGGKVQTAFSHIKIFTARDLNIIEIADSISKTYEGFQKIHSDAEQILESFLDSVFKLIEPVMMVLLAFIIGMIMYLIISPTLAMMETL